MIEFDGRDLRHQRVQAADAKQAGHQLVGGRAVIGVPQDDLANRVADPVLPRVVETAKPDHVPRVVGLGRVPRSRLPRADGEEALLLQAAQDLDGRDGAKAFRTAGVRPRREDRRGGAAHLVFRKRAGAVVEAGGAGGVNRAANPRPFGRRRTSARRRR